MFARPFDICCKIQDSFKQCLRDHSNSNEEDIENLTLGDSWDPLTVTLRLIKWQYDIKVSDMFNEPSEIFEAGTVKKLLPHGKSGAGIRSPEHDNETQSNKRIKHDPMDVLQTGVDATAIKDKIIANVRKLDKDHRINAKAWHAGMSLQETLQCCSLIKRIKD